MNTTSESPVRVLHGLHMISALEDGDEQYSHYLAVMVSDIAADSSILKAEQFNLKFQPYMNTEGFIQALRSFADAVEEYDRSVPLAVG